MGARMGGKIHSELLNRVMNAPQNLFFDITPLGKLLSNFTSDMRRCGPDFYDHLNWVLEVSADFVIKISFALSYEPRMILPILVNIYMLYGLNNITMNGKNEI